MGWVSCNTTMVYTLSVESLYSILFKVDFCILPILNFIVNIYAGLKTPGNIHYISYSIGPPELTRKQEGGRPSEERLGPSTLRGWFFSSLGNHISR